MMGDIPANLPYEAPAAASSGAGSADGGESFADFLWDGGEFGIGDVLDAINPLQHLPIISMLYREIAGDDIGAAPRLAGGAIFGGLLGLAASVFNIVLEEVTGDDVGGHVADLFRGDGEDETPDGGPTMLAFAGTMNEPFLGEPFAAGQDDPAPAQGPRPAPNERPTTLASVGTMNEPFLGEPRATSTRITLATAGATAGSGDVMPDAGRVSAIRPAAGLPRVSRFSADTAPPEGGSPLTNAGRGTRHRPGPAMSATGRAQLRPPVFAKQHLADLFGDAIARSQVRDAGARLSRAGPARGATPARGASIPRAMGYGLDKYRQMARQRTHASPVIDIRR